MATIEDKYNKLVKELNLKEYYDKGYTGKGIIVASVESTDSDHGRNVKCTCLTYAPDVTFISYNDCHEKSATGDDGTNAEFPKFVDWCIENKVDIVTSSLSWTCNHEEEKQAIRKLYENGIIYVNCAGNESHTLEHRENGNQPYTFDKESICVGAVQYDMTKNKFKKASFSNYGEAIDVMMEGDASPMKSFFDPTDEDYEDSVKKYGRNYLWVGFSGTSASTPMIAGLLAVYKSYDKKLNSKNVFDLINASYIPLEYDNIEYKIFKMPVMDTITLKEEVKNMEDKPDWKIEFEEVWDRATKLKVVDGTRPSDPITRNELVVILDRLGLLK